MRLIVLRVSYKNFNLEINEYIHRMLELLSIIFILLGGIFLLALIIKLIVFIGVEIFVWVIGTIFVILIIWGVCALVGSIFDYFKDETIGITNKCGAIIIAIMICTVIFGVLTTDRKTPVNKWDKYRIQSQK